MRFGNKVVVAGGLVLMAVGFVWISTSSMPTPAYLEIVGQMLVTAGGLGLATAPATEAIMGVVPKEKAGVGSAVNDATRELGGTLGVAVIGSMFASLYLHALDGNRPVRGLPRPCCHALRQSVGTGAGTGVGCTLREPSPKQRNC